MAEHRAKKAQHILDRLASLEKSQQDLMQRLQSSHERQMSQLRKQLEDAQHRCASASTNDQLIQVQPVFMQVDMTEVDAAVQAASYAEQESLQALAEARKVADEARIAAGGIPATIEAASTAATEDEIAYGPDSEYIVKKVSVNLDQVERVINNSNYVHMCRAFGLPDPKYGNEVFCAVVPKKMLKFQKHLLRYMQKNIFPTAMVPKRYYFVTDLPAGITRKALADTHMAGELDRKSLIAPEHRPLIEH